MVMEKINIAELLKNCPKGMKLYSPIFGEVYLDKIRPHLAIVVTTDKEQGDFKEEFLYDGRYGMNGECMLFPSKDKTTWKGFKPPCKFKDGDILFVDCSDGEDKNYQYIFILNKPEFYGKWHSYCHLVGDDSFHSKETYLTDDEYNPRFATEDEKETLFKVIKYNGYKWNAETKTLEKLIEPKFKLGDRVKPIYNNNQYDIIGLTDTHYTLVEVENKFKYTEPIIEDKNWELVPNKFDITTLKPFDKVLVRGSDKQSWYISFFSHCNKLETYKYSCINGVSCAQCIPYEGNEHLLDTTNDCDEFYKTWE